MNENQYFEEGTGELNQATNDETIRATVIGLIERYAPKKEERLPVVVVLGPDPHISKLLRDHLRQEEVVLIDATAAAEKQQQLFVTSKLLEMLDVLTKHCLPEPMECPAEVLTASTVLPTVAKIKTAGTRFNQFTNNQRCKGPSTHRQFAMIRPPRRGGR